MESKKNFSVLIGLLMLTSATADTKNTGMPADPLLIESSNAFYKEDYDTSLNLLEKYFKKLSTMPTDKAKKLFRFSAIASMGRVFLQFKQDPNGAIQWFEKMEKTHLLSEAEHDIIDGWIAGTKDWIKLGKFPKDLQNPDELFDLGKKYYSAGLKKQKYTMDTASSADFSIAASYLMPFIVHHDKNQKIGDALFMMGDIRRRIWIENQHWSENYYLTEVIRRFPGTPLALKAYQALDEDVHFAYTGSAGDQTPASWIELLHEFKALAKAAPSPLPRVESLK